MVEKEFVKKAIANIEIETNRYSILNLAVRDARLITGRNIDTGKLLQNEFLVNKMGEPLDQYSFIGIINYLLILDMIGNAFSIKQFTTTKTTSIYKSLKQFSTLNDDDIYAIIALRNSLAHNYSLVNIPAHKEFSSKLHHFKLINGSTQKMIKIKSKWGNPNNSKSEINETVIGVDNLLDMIEGVILNLKKENELDNLELNLDFNQFVMRYTVQN